MRPARCPPTRAPREEDHHRCVGAQSSLVAASLASAEETRTIEKLAGIRLKSLARAQVQRRRARCGRGGASCDPLRRPTRPQESERHRQDRRRQAELYADEQMKVAARGAGPRRRPCSHARARGQMALSGLLRNIQRDAFTTVEPPWRPPLVADSSRALAGYASRGALRQGGRARCGEFATAPRFTTARRFRWH
jgi:hypothetical protein